MARARNIKPGIMANEDLAECTPMSRLLFVYLWMLADRKGRLEDRPKRIGAQALPYDSVDADALLDELSAHDFIERYEVDGEKYIQINNFAKHQAPHCKEKESTIPAPEKHGTSTVQAPDKHQKSTEAAPPDSLIPDSLIPDSLNNTPASPAVDVCRFDEFWDAYPKKRDKKKAKNVWKRDKLNAMADKIIGDVKQRVMCDRQWINGYVQNPTTYLNGERWDDEIERADSGGQKTNANGSALDKVRASIAASEGRDGEAVADDDPNVRPQMVEQLWGRSGPPGSVGRVIEGSFTRND